MKFWLSGEVDHRAAESFRLVRIEFEASLNAALGENDYGPWLKELNLIPMLLGPEFLEGRPERRLVQRKEKSSDYRLSIDFAAWQAGADLDRKALLMKNVIDSVRDIGRKLGKGFDAKRLEADLIAAFPAIANHSFNGDVAKATPR